MKRLLVSILFLACFGGSGNSQIKRTTMPLGDALNKALGKMTLTTKDSQPFHIHVTISEPDNPQSPYRGTIEEWWLSPERWRRETTDQNGLRQTIVVTNGHNTEVDEGDYFPLWLRRFEVAVFEGVPDVAAWTASGLQIEQMTMPNGAQSDACVRTEAKIGEGERATSSYSNLCFDNDGKLNFFGSPRYSMEFHNYQRFGKKNYPRSFVDDPEPGTRLVGEVTVLEDESKAKSSADLFLPLSANDHRFASVRVSSAQMQHLSEDNPGIVWPLAHSGNVHGHLAMYISVDANGKVREAWPLNSDNAGLQDVARDQVRQWILKTASDSGGNRVQVDGGLSFSFDTKIGDPLPELTDMEVRGLATVAIDPQWPTKTLPVGDVIEVQIAVNEKGELTGTEFRGVPSIAVGLVNAALRQWQFRPLMRAGKPQYFHGSLHFVVH